VTVTNIEPGQPTDLNSYDKLNSTVLVKTEQFHVLRVVVEAGNALPAHKVDGPITVQCLSGRCRFLVEREPKEMQAGCWLYLNGGTKHAIEAVDTSVLLVTRLLGDKSESP